MPSAAGRILFGEVYERVQELTAQLAEGLEPTDIETTRRVLATITERASVLAATGPSAVGQESKPSPSRSIVRSHRLRRPVRS